MKVAILVNALVNRGGADRIVLEMAKHWNADVYAGIYDPETTYPEFKRLRVTVLLPGAKPSRFNSIRVRRAFAKLRAPGYDTYIFHGSHCMTAVPHHQPALWYCHAPPRWMYDLYDDEVNARKNPLSRFLFKLVRARMMREDQYLVSKVGTIVANSENVRQRVKKFYGREAIVVNPLVDVLAWKWISQGDYYLSPARLDPIKRIDLIVRAFQQMPGKKLVIASNGPDRERILSLAKGYENINVLGRWSTDEEMHELMGKCIAIITPGYREDFGMIAIEANAAGKPVIATDDCGFQETVVPGKTGLLLPEPVTPEKIVKAVKFLAPARARSMRLACERHARKYDTRKFFEKMDDILIHKHYKKAGKTFMCQMNNVYRGMR